MKSFAWCKRFKKATHKKQRKHNNKKEEEINVIDICDCAEILSAMKDRIKNVEVYYNPYTTKLVSVIEEAKIYNIVTQKEV